MISYADTSFLAALFLEQDHAEQAWDWWRSHETEPLLLSRLTRLEFAAVVHSHVCSGMMQKEEADHSLRGLDAALSEGLLIMRSPSPEKLFAQAHRLIEHFSTGFACKSLDILHVAAAVVSRADTLVSFDAAQKRLAVAAGLEVFP